MQADPDDSTIPNWMVCGHVHLGRHVRCMTRGSEWDGLVTAYAFSSQKGRSTEAVVWKVEEQVDECEGQEIVLNAHKMKEAMKEKLQPPA